MAVNLSTSRNKLVYPYYFSAKRSRFNSQLMLITIVQTGQIRVFASFREPDFRCCRNQILIRNIRDCIGIYITKLFNLFQFG